MPVKRATQAQPNALLRRARQERGWSQQEVADLIGAPQAYMVTRWENGTGLPGPGYREKLCALFHKSRQELGFLKPLSEGPSPAGLLASLSDPAIPSRVLQVRTLIGRDQMFSQLQQQLCGPDPAKRLAVDGLPGVGKTALATELAVSPELQAFFVDGILWAGLGPHPNIQVHLHRWGKLLSLPEAENGAVRESEALAQALRQALWNRRVLLVLDDVWSIEDALVCMVGGPDCAYLLTTRIPEVATRFAGACSVHLSELSQEDGIGLLAQIAPGVQKMEPTMVRSLVQAVGGLPLALTLMGNYLLLQTRHQQRRRVQTILTQLQQAEERLRLAQSRSDGEHDPRLPADTPLTLQAMIGLSDAVLDEEARQALYALAVFPAKPASFSEEAALAVTGAPAEVLDRLVDVGLLESKGADRYTLHQTIADYASGQQRAETQAERRLVTYTVAFVQQHREAYRALEQELMLILTVLDYAPRVGCRDEFVQCMCVAARFLRSSGFASLTEQLLQQAYEIAKHHHDWQHFFTIVYELGLLLRERGAYEQAEALLDEGLALARQQADPHALISMLLMRGTVATMRIGYERAETFFSEALALSRQINDPEAIYRSLTSLCVISEIQGKFAQNEIYIEEALALTRLGKSKHRSLIVLANLGWIEGRQGKFAEAEAHLQEAIELAREGQYHDILSFMLIQSGWTLLAHDEYQRARNCLQESFTLGQQTGQVRILADALVGLACIALKQGDLAQANSFLQEALAPLYTLDSHKQTSLFLLVKGQVEIQHRAYPQAYQTLQEGLALARQVGHAEYICSLLLSLGRGVLEMEDPDQASMLLTEGLALANQIEIPWLIGEGLAVQGAYHLKCQEYEEAAARYQEILARVLPDCREVIARAHEGLAHVAAAQGQLDQARQQGQAALDLFEAIDHGRTPVVSAWLSAL
ncbi:MAG TPA: tetratricopeptide repeat protein [Ktedonosporobacter sp.]|nr:tetratricopeptide repeat protein [Ktedonosporobacter sp.]